MENKRFNYIEFKLAIMNNELQFLEKYLIENVKNEDVKNENVKNEIKVQLEQLIDRIKNIKNTYFNTKDEKIIDYSNLVSQINYII